VVLLKELRQHQVPFKHNWLYILDHLRFFGSDQP
jgi:hypothetical protein